MVIVTTLHLTSLSHSLAIDAQQSSVQALLDTGDKLLDEGHYKAFEIDEKLRDISERQVCDESMLIVSDVGFY